MAVYLKNIEYPNVLNKEVGIKSLRTEKIDKTDDIDSLNIMDKISVSKDWDKLNLFKSGEFIPKFDFSFINIEEKVKPFKWVKMNNFITLYLSLKVGNLNNSSLFLDIYDIPEEIKPKEKFHLLIPCKMILNRLSGISKLEIGGDIKNKIRIYFEHSKYPENPEIHLPVGQIYEIKNCSVSYYLD